MFAMPRPKCARENWQMAEIPIKLADGIELVPKHNGIAAVTLQDPLGRRKLSWDRFVRLQAAGRAVSNASAATVLDAGGYDGALAFFLPDLQLDLIDPITTGGSILAIPAIDRSYDAVVAVDVLEHIEPNDRAKALSELARVARHHVILNYPCQDSKAAQEIALKLTGNALIREHVQWDLPDSEWVLSELAAFGFHGIVTPHTSIAVWLPYYVALNLVPDAAGELNQHLLENYTDEPCSRALYHLVICRR
jgi:hypothetical protein